MVDTGATEEVAPGVHATYLDAGHILGSAIIRVRVEAGGSAGAASGPASSSGSQSRPQRAQRTILPGFSRDAGTS